MPFLSFAADILADTSNGLSGNEVVKAFNVYAVEYNVNIPHAVYPFDSPGGWRLIGRTALRPFDVAADPPALIVAGDRVRFIPV